MPNLLLAIAAYIIGIFVLFGCVWLYADRLPDETDNKSDQKHNI